MAGLYFEISGPERERMMSEFNSKRKIILNLAAVNEGELINAFEDAFSIVKEELNNGDADVDFAYAKYQLSIEIENPQDEDDENQDVSTETLERPIFLVLKYLPETAGYTCWLTSNPGDDSTGISSAGLSNSREGVTDAMESLDAADAESLARIASRVMIADLTSLEEKALDMRPGEFNDLVRDIAVPFADWKDLMKYGSERDWFLTTKDNYFFSGTGSIQRQLLVGCKFHENILAMYNYVRLVNSLKKDEPFYCEFHVDTNKKMFFDTQGVGAEYREDTPEQFINEFSL